MSLACIGIGSNAIRLLEADWNEGSLKVLKRERIGTRLFAGLVDGVLQQNNMQTSIDAVAELARIAKEDQTDGLFIFATSAVRDARNGKDFTDACEACSGATVEIISGEQEAIYSYYGAARGTSSGVIDIGGGSTEFTLGHDQTILFAKSVQMGAVRMHEALPISSAQEYEETVARCTAIIKEGTANIPPVDADCTWTGVGGTMTTLGAMSQKIEEFDPVESEGMLMTAEEVREWGRSLSNQTLEQRRTIVGLMPHRADIMPSGIAILDASMRFFGISSIHLSACGNMDGYLKKKFQKRY